MRVDEDRLQALFEQLERCWRDNHAPILDCLAPGISGERIDELTAPLGITVPTELKLWWGWHNGTLFPANDAPQLVSLGVGMSYQPLQAAIERYGDCRRWFQLVEEGIFWQPSWLPIAFWDSKACLFVDTADVAPGDVVPVRGEPDEWEQPGRALAPSFADVIAVWVQALEQRYYWFDAAAGAWEYDWDAVPVDLRMSGLLY